MSNSLLFTPASLLDLLSQIEELKSVDIGISESIDGDIQLQVGDSVYMIDTSDALDVEVSEDVVDDIEDYNMESYDSMYPESEYGSEDIESGIIKEIAKTLLVGGLVRLTGKLLRK